MENKVMKYMLLMYADESIAQKFTPEEYQAAGQAWYALGNELSAAGVLLSNSGLSSVTTATPVRGRDGKTVTADGPFAETHEQLGGYYLLQRKAPDQPTRSAPKLPSAKTAPLVAGHGWSPQK